MNVRYRTYRQNKRADTASIGGAIVIFITKPDLLRTVGSGGILPESNRKAQIDTLLRKLPGVSAKK